MGALGLGPLAAVGPVSVGPSASGLERTTAEASRVVVRVDPVQSLAQRRIIMSLRLNDTQVRSSGHLRRPTAHCYFTSKMVTLRPEIISCCDAFEMPTVGLSHVLTCSRVRVHEL